MIAATSILAVAAPAAPGAGKAAPQGGEDFAPFDLKALTEGETEAAAPPAFEETEAPPELAALAGQGLEQMILLQVQEAKAPVEGEAVAGILEGNTSSIGMDTELLLPEAPLTGQENEEIMARMPQIIVKDDEMENSAAKVTENLSGGNLCPLENIDEAIAMEQPEKTEAHQERELFADAALRLEAPEQKAESSTDTEQKGKDQSGFQPKTGETQQASQAAAALSASGSQPTAEAELTYIRETIPTAMQRLEELIEGFDGANKQVKIHLEPEHLGKLAISLSMGPEGLRAKIDTDNLQTQAVLSGELSKLLQKLGESGVKVERMDILCAGDFQQDANQTDSGAFSGQQFAREQRSYAAAPEAVGNEGLDLYDVYTQVEGGQSHSSVEYRA